MKDKVTFYRNLCPVCQSEDLQLLTSEDGEEVRVKCNKCGGEFSSKDTTKQQVGETKEM